MNAAGVCHLQAVILAGGLGTRLRPLTLQVPKPMIRVADKPYLEYQLRLLKKNGFQNFVICVGYKSEIIEDYFGDGEKLNLSISYSRDGERQLGPIGGLKNASELLDSEFMVTYGDSFLQMDYRRFETEFKISGKLGMMAVLENHNKYGRSDIVVNNGIVIEYDKSKQRPEMVWINYGATMLQKASLDLIPPNVEIGEEQFYHSLIDRRELAVFKTFNRFYEIGTISGLKEFEKLLSENPNLLAN